MSWYPVYVLRQYSHFCKAYKADKISMAPSSAVPLENKQFTLFASQTNTQCVSYDYCGYRK